MQRPLQRQPLQQQCDQLLATAMQSFSEDAHTSDSRVYVKQLLSALLPMLAGVLQSTFQLHSGYEQKAQHELQKAVDSIRCFKLNKSNSKHDRSME